jgi:hypothetical protein
LGGLEGSQWELDEYLFLFDVRSFREDIEDDIDEAPRGSHDTSLSGSSWKFLEGPRWDLDKHLLLFGVRLSSGRDERPPRS